jgi:hypothetical protein
MIFAPIIDGRMYSYYVLSGTCHLVRYCTCKKCFTLGRSLFTFRLADQCPARLQPEGFCNLSHLNTRGYPQVSGKG